MEIRERSVGSATILEPVGRLEGKALPILEQRIQGLMKQARSHFVIDLADVESIDSVGLRLLLTVAKKLGPSDGDLVLCSLSEEVQEIFDTVGLGSVFSIASSRDEAIAFLRQGKGKARKISRLAVRLLEVGEKSAGEADGPADHTRTQRISKLATGLMMLSEERPLSGEGAEATVAFPPPEEAEDTDRAASRRGLFSGLWSKIRGR